MDAQTIDKTNYKDNSPYICCLIPKKEVCRMTHNQLTMNLQKVSKSQENNVSLPDSAMIPHNQLTMNLQKVSKSQENNVSLPDSAMIPYYFGLVSNNSIAIIIILLCFQVKETVPEISEKMETLDIRKLRVVLVPLPLQGHLTPMLQLGTILHSRGFSVIVAHTEFNSPNPGNHPQFTFFPLSDGVCSGLGNLLEIIAAINTNCKEPLEKCIVKFQEELQCQISCIIYDSLMHFVEAVAHHLKLPSIFFRASTAVYMQSYHAILTLQEKKIFPLPDSQLQESVPGLHSVIRYKDLPVSVSSKIPEVLIEFIKSFSNIRSSVAVIWNTVEILDHWALQQLQQQYQVPFFPIGPLHKLASSSSSSSSSSSLTSLLPEDTSCIAWLDKQAPKSVLYVSLGSLATMDDKGLVETAWGIANSGQPFLWAIRPSSVTGSEWIECLPEGFTDVIQERGLIVKWAPQKKVLAHWAVGGFLSHCGWNSTLESICEGVAIICRPCFGDQMINARFLIHVWKVGVELENVVDRKSIEKAVRMLMVQEQGNEMRRRAVELKHELQLSVQKDGSSYRSLDDLVEFTTSFPLQK